MAIPKPYQVCWYNFLKVIISVSSRFVNHVDKTQFLLVCATDQDNKTKLRFPQEQGVGYYSRKAGSLEEQKNFERDKSPKSLGWQFIFFPSYRPLVHLKTSFSFLPHNSHLSVDIFSWQSQSLKCFLITAHPQFLLCLLAPLVLAPCRQQA